MTQVRGPRLDDQLLRALHEGPAALPDDLNRLLGYMRLIAMLLAEKAQEHEPEWRLVLGSAAEIETLLNLEALVVEKAIGVPARTLPSLLVKFAIWAALQPEGEDFPAIPRRDLRVESARRDLERLARLGGRRRGPVPL